MVQIDRTSILTSLERFQEQDLNTKGGNVWAYVYDSGIREAEEIAMEAYQMYADHNGLDFTVFPSLLKLENQIIGKVAPLFSDDPQSLAGSFTSGGTESIILAVKAARDYARTNRPNITKPEIILPSTAHAAFHKAAHYLHITPVIVPVNDEFKVEAKTVEKHITNNTIMMVGSSVSYSHGVCDPIDALGKIAVDHDIWFHVDACIGGLVLAYFRDLGHDTPAFDFSVPGVTSLSVDIHKYGFAPKGASVVLYRNKDYRKYQFYTCTNWTGYPVVNTTIQSTKSGGPLAACWATMTYFGEEGYKKIFQDIYDTKQKMLQQFSELADIYVLGNPEASLIAFGSKTIDLFQLADEMRKDGWYVQLQPGNETFEPTIHLTITPVSKDIADKFFTKLRHSIERIKEQPRQPVMETFGPVLQQLGQIEGNIEPEMMQQLLQVAGVDEEGQLPEEMATINELLHLLPSELTSEAFLHITNELFSTELSN